MKRGIKTNLKRYRVQSKGGSRWNTAVEVLAANPLAALSAYYTIHRKRAIPPYVKKTKKDWGYTYYHVKNEANSFWPAGRFRLWELD